MRYKKRPKAFGFELVPKQGRNYLATDGHRTKTDKSERFPSFGSISFLRICISSVQSVAKSNGIKDFGDLIISIRVGLLRFDGHGKGGTTSTVK
jgi:hypothetical protein